MESRNKKLDELDFRVVRTQKLSSAERASLHQVFELSFQEPNHSYLEKSLAKLRYIALAFRGKELVCFTVGDIIETTIPRMTSLQVVHLGGLTCTSPDFRRMGLFVYLQRLISMESDLVKPDLRILTCGRMAHPASYRVLSSHPGAIPKHDVILSEWHKEVGLRIAELYGIDIDPKTFVVPGDGSPIGYPRMNIDATEEEWCLFKNVDRKRGDLLLCMAWHPDPPEGW